jgi:hypothetical protein
MNVKNLILILGMITIGVLAVKLFTIFKNDITAPFTGPISKAEWMRVDKDFENSNCTQFCISKGKTCAVSGCKPDQWCKASGGMMEIETWDSSVGTVCDRVWEGQCNATIDRYPPYYNFHCCCI